MSRIAVVGCGAMGSIYAGLLASAGNDVLAVDRSAAHIDAIARHGLRVSGASGDRTVAVDAHTDVPDVGPAGVDLVILAVKAGQVAEAAAASRRLLGPDTLVLTIQNGLGSAEVVAAEVGEDRLLVGVAAGFGASRPEPGHVHHNDMKAIRMGAHVGVAAERVEAVARLWRDAGFDAEATDDIAAMQWEKLICNVAYSAVCALSGATLGEVLDHPELGRVSRAAATEAWSVALDLGVAIDVADPVEHVRAFGARMPAAKPSVLLDLEAGRPSEIDVINGAVGREAARIGRDAPVNDTLTDLVLALERAGRR